MTTFNLSQHDIVKKIRKRNKDFFNPSQTPLWVTRNLKNVFKNMHQHHRRVLAYLKCLTNMFGDKEHGVVTVTQEKIAARIGVSLRTVQKILNQLISWGLVVDCYRHLRSNLFRLADIFKKDSVLSVVKKYIYEFNYSTAEVSLQKFDLIDLTQRLKDNTLNPNYKLSYCRQELYSPSFINKLALSRQPNEKDNELVERLSTENIVRARTENKNYKNENTMNETYTSMTKKNDQETVDDPKKLNKLHEIEQLRLKIRAKLAADKAHKEKILNQAIERLEEERRLKREKLEKETEDDLFNVIDFAFNLVRDS